LTEDVDTKSNNTSSHSNSTVQWSDKPVCRWLEMPPSFTARHYFHEAV